MFARLLLLFTVIPLLELTLLVQIGKATSLTFTVGLVLLTGALGAYLARREGLRAAARLRADTAAGRPPAAAVLDGVLILVAGAVLLTPGLLTDLFGFALLIPQVRTALATRLAEALKRRVRTQMQTFAAHAGVRPGPPPSEDVIDVEFTKVRTPDAHLDGASLGRSEDHPA